MMNVSSSQSLNADAESGPRPPEQQQAANSGPDFSSASLQPRLSWQSFRSSLSLSEKTSANLGWTIAFLSVLFTIIALSPTFKSQFLSEKQLKLAQWTALKDYIEECREEVAAGIQTQACLKAINIKLPPPPYTKPGTLDRREFLSIEVVHNNTGKGPGAWQQPVGFSSIIKQCSILGGFTLLALLAWGLMRSYIRIVRESSPRDKVNEEWRLLPQMQTVREGDSLTTTIRHPPATTDSTLRRRIVRTHPIYRHANLEEAIHHEDMAEIRLRLRNGEDVNRHWPYLIYKLAISPPSINTPKHLAIAQLCLDFGADVNALKGWNGQSALMIAIHFGNVQVAKLLIANGALVTYSPPDSNLTALHRCVRLAVTGSASDALEIMELLFDYGAEANQTDRAGETALHKLLIDAWLKRDIAGCIQKLTPIALCLIDHGAHMPTTLKDKYMENNPLWTLVAAAFSKQRINHHLEALQNYLDSS